jgi:hypothetical protein
MRSGTLEHAFSILSQVTPLRPFLSWFGWSFHVTARVIWTKRHKFMSYKKTSSVCASFKNMTLKTYQSLPQLCKCVTFYWVIVHLLINSSTKEGNGNSYFNVVMFVLITSFLEQTASRLIDIWGWRWYTFSVKCQASFPFETTWFFNETQQ